MKLKLIILLLIIGSNQLMAQCVNNSITMLLTYPILANDILWESQQLQPNLQIAPYNLSVSNNNLTYNNIYFNGQEVNGCYLNGINYTCLANNNITIDGDIDVASGYHVDFIAGNEIYVINESNISPEAVLMIQENPIYDYSHPMPKATSNEIYNFCQNSNLYQANEKGGKLKKMEDSLQQIYKDEKAKEQMRQDFNFSMYPNPTTNQANIIIDRLLLGGITISVKDVAGKTVEVITNQQNDNTYVLDVNNLESGIYFVTVSTYGFSKTKRLVITK